MKRRVGLALSVLSMCLFIAELTQAAGNPEDGEKKAATCLGCHGVPGYYSVYPSYRVPKLGGQHADYMVAALQAYKAGQRTHSTMRAQASTLSDEDMADIAAYFASKNGG